MVSPHNLFNTNISDASILCCLANVNMVLTLKLHLVSAQDSVASDHGHTLTEAHDPIYD